jgi:hypothetical protein
MPNLLASLVALGLVAAPARPPSIELVYHGSGDDPEPYSVSQPEPGAILGLAVDGTNLRASASTTAEVLAALPLGARVKVRAPGAALSRIDQRFDRWHEVEVLEPAALAGKRGYLFGAALTPAVFRVDLDGDGALDEVAVAWTWNFKVRVRVRAGTPAGAAAAEPAKVETLDVDPAGQAYACCGGEATVELLAASVAGVPLVHLSTNARACGDTGEHWVSFLAVKGAPPRLRESLKAFGLTDPPSNAEVEARFDPKARAVTLVQRVWSDDELDARGKPKVETTTRRLRLVDGTYR